MNESIGPVVRALSVLRALNHQPHSSLLRLHQATGLPKPTVHRLLRTLKNEGYVRSDVVKGTYSLTAKVRELSDGFTEKDLVVQLGEPLLVRTTRKTGLPLAIGMIDRAQMLVRYSSMPYSPIGHENTTLGHSHDLIRSGMGQAFMAFCDENERLRLLEWLQLATPDPKQWTAMQAELSANIAATRARGYGLRMPEDRSHSATVAVPIYQDTRVLGVLSLTVFSGLLVDATLRECVAVLRQTSAELSSLLEKHLALPG